LNDQTTATFDWKSFLTLCLCAEFGAAFNPEGERIRWSREYFLCDLNVLSLGWTEDSKAESDSEDTDDAIDMDISDKDGPSSISKDDDE
jgi:hypothetical protein